VAGLIVDKVDSVVKADGMDGANDADGAEDIDCSCIRFEGPDITRPSTRPPTSMRLGVKGPVMEGANDVNGADDAGGADDAAETDSDPNRLEGPDIGGPDGSG
jgi:hypothetical protein